VEVVNRFADGRMGGWVFGRMNVSFGWTYGLGVDWGDGLGVRSRDNTLPIELLGKTLERIILLSIYTFFCFSV
jgi:hypothetical protein